MEAMWCVQVSILTVAVLLMLPVDSPSVQFTVNKFLWWAWWQSIVMILQNRWVHPWVQDCFRACVWRLHKKTEGTCNSAYSYCMTSRYQRTRLYTRIALGKAMAMDVVSGESSGNFGQLLLL
jgi:hypothetical protein